MALRGYGRDSSVIKTKQHSPEGFFSYARSYARAADVLLQNGTPDTRIPVLFLLAHSLELSLKAFLLSQDVDAVALSRKPYGHDVEYCLTDSLSRGLLHGRELPPEERLAVVTVSGLFKEKELNYLYEYPKGLPDADALCRSVRRVLSAVFDAVSAPYFAGEREG